jgi:hypothetical protein
LSYGVCKFTGSLFFFILLLLSVQEFDRQYFNLSKCDGEQRPNGRKLEGPQITVPRAAGGKTIIS